MAGTKYTAEQYAFVERCMSAGMTARQTYEAWVDNLTLGRLPNFNAFRLLYKHIKNGGRFQAPIQPVVAREPEVQPEPDIAAISREEQERMKREHERKTLNLLKRERAATDMILDGLREAAPAIPSVRVPLLDVPGGPHREQTAVLLLSDLHIGANTDIEETGGLGEYNYEIFRERLRVLREGIRSIANHHRMSHPVKNLVVLSLGDIIENVSIFPAQRDAADDLMFQVLRAMGDLSEFYLGMLDTFEHISVVAVSGNHGRIGRKGEYKHHVNWDYLISKTLEDKFKVSTVADRVSFSVPKSPFAVVDVEGWTFLLRHGDGIKSWGGIPFYGVQRSTGRWVAIQESIGHRFDYMAMGHFHQVANLPYTGGEVLMNGSFVGSSQFSVEVMETLSRPVQIFGMVHPKHGLAARYPIHLDPGRKI